MSTKGDFWSSHICDASDSSWADVKRGSCDSKIARSPRPLNMNVGFANLASVDDLDDVDDANSLESCSL